MKLRPNQFNRGNIYLSGGMQYAKDLGGAWREIASDRLKQMGYFPLDITALDISYSKKHGELYLPDRNQDNLIFKSNIRKHFVYTDLSLIEYHSDALIVYYDESARRGAGTISECQFAYNLNIPIFLVSAYEDMIYEVPGWLQALTTKMFNNFEDLYQYLEKLPRNILTKDIYGNNRSGKDYLCHMCGTVFTKNKHIFVSEVKPLLCGECVNIVHETHTKHKDRYEFFVEYLEVAVGASEHVRTAMADLASAGHQERKLKAKKHKVAKMPHENGGEVINNLVRPKHKRQETPIKAKTKKTKK